ncbi:hypothetical protein ACFV1U_12580 [Streptomyces microflavus]|uniref:hypothetical protein n=1 Tax=Streptomyces microflavus TaxID=1919 RepID=UPI0036CEB97F
MKYTVRHACGHEQVHNITGPDTRGQRQRTADRHAQQDCTNCRSRAREKAQEHAAARAAESAKVSMPDLTGTPKHVTWAESLRERALAQLVGQPESVRAAAEQKTASWWIDHRDDLAGALAASRRPESGQHGEDDPQQPAGTDQWDLLGRAREVSDAAPLIRTRQQRGVARMLLVALWRMVYTDNPADRDPGRRAELAGEVKTLRRVLTEQLDVPLGMPLNQPLGVPGGTDWQTLTPEQRDKSEYLWLRREFDRSDTYNSQTDPAARLQRAWLDWDLASSVADQALDTLAAEAASVNAPNAAPHRLSFQQIADAVPADRGRSWAQWLVRRGQQKGAAE